MNSPTPDIGPSRRHLIKTAAALGAGTLATGIASAAPATAPMMPEYVDGAAPGATAPGTPTLGYGAPLANTKLQPIPFKRRPVGRQDVEIEILYTGVCHSDVHFVHNDWKNTIYPCIPGHEIVGRVLSVGDGVTKYKAGDTVAVGPIVDSCGQCAQCKENLEQYCEGPKGRTEVYNGPAKPDGTNTYGGYSNRLVVKDHFVLKVPANLDLKAVPPLLCAGVTTYSPLRHWNAGPGKKVGVVGLGGLGHMAVKLAKAMGAEVTVFSTSPEKEADAMKFGATKFVVSKDADAMMKMDLTLDLIINTIPYPFDVNMYVKPLKRDGTLVNVGALVPFAAPTDNSLVAFHRRSVTGSLIGGALESQECLDFCGKHNIVSTVEVIPIDKINDAFLNVKSGKVRYRYVIDVAGSLKA